MNDQHLADTINSALANIIECAPGPAPWPVRQQTLQRSSPRQRWMVPIAASAVGIAGVTGVVVVGGRDTDAPGRGAPATVASTPPTSQAPAVVGDPTCGAELPVTVTVPGASMAILGPAVDPAPIDGQYVAHWDGDFGVVEIRWPADPRILYDLTGDHADSDIGPRYVQLEMAGDGSSIDASLEVASVWNGAPVSMAPTSVSLLHLERAPGEGDAASPCDVVQVRYLGDEGWHATAGYFWPEFSAVDHPMPDLHPLIVSTEASASPPTAQDVTPCDPERGVRGGTTMGNPVAPTPAEALLAYLGEAATGYVGSGYNEYVAQDGDLYVYTYRASYDQAMITALITVERDGDGWSVTAQYGSGC